MTMPNATQYREPRTVAEYIDAWLSLLPLVAGQGWDLDTGGALRNLELRCPICALLHATHGTKSYGTWGLAYRRAFKRQLSLAEYDALWGIVKAADIPTHPLRPRLLDALDLAEVPNA